MNNKNKIIDVHNIADDELKIVNNKKINIDDAHNISEIQQYIDAILTPNSFGESSTIIRVYEKIGTLPVVIPVGIQVHFIDCHFKNSITLLGKNTVTFDRCIFSEDIIINKNKTEDYKCDVVIYGGGPLPERSYAKNEIDEYRLLYNKYTVKQRSTIYKKIEVNNSVVWIYDTQWMKNSYITCNNSIIKVEGLPSINNEYVNKFDKMFNTVKNSIIYMERLNYIASAPSENITNSTIIFNVLESNNPATVMFKNCSNNSFYLNNCSFGNFNYFMESCTENMIKIGSTLLSSGILGHLIEGRASSNPAVSYIEKVNTLTNYNQTITKDLEFDNNSISILKFKNAIFKSCTLNTLEMENTKTRIVFDYFTEASSLNTLSFYNMEFGTINNITTEQNSTYLFKYCVFEIVSNGLFNTDTCIINIKHSSFNTINSDMFLGTSNKINIMDTSISTVVGTVFAGSSQNIIFRTSTINTINNYYVNFINSTIITMDSSINTVTISFFKSTASDIQNINSTFETCGTNFFETTESNVISYNSTYNISGADGIKFTSSSGVFDTDTFLVIGDNFFNSTDSVLTLKNSNIQDISLNGFLGSNNTTNIRHTIFKIIGLNFYNDINSKHKIHKTIVDTINLNWLNSTGTIVDSYYNTFNTISNNWLNCTNCKLIDDSSIFKVSPISIAADSELILYKTNIPLLTTLTLNTCNVMFTKTIFEKLTKLTVSNSSLRFKQNEFPLLNILTFESVSFIFEQNNILLGEYNLTTSSGIFMNNDGVAITLVSGSRIDLIESQYTVTTGSQTENCNRGIFANDDVYLVSDTINILGDTINILGDTEINIIAPQTNINP